MFRWTGFFFLPMVLFGVWLASPALDFPWFWDDYHLIRAFSAPERWQAIVGPWDIDGLEFPSFRPLTMLLNHCRGWLLGEFTWAHRIAGIVLCALFLGIACGIMVRLGLKPAYAGAAGLLILATPSDTANLIWITEAAHALSGLIVLLGAVVVFSRCLTWRHGLILYAAALAGMLVREDIAALFPFVVLMSFVSRNEAFALAAPAGSPERRPEPPIALGHTVLVVLCLAAAVSTCLLLQLLAVPRTGLAVQPIGGLFHLYWTLLLTGPGSAIGTAVQLALPAAALLSLLLIRHRMPAKFTVWGLFACAILGCSPGFIQQRMDLLLVPETMYVFFLAAALQLMNTHWARAFTTWLTAIAWLGGMIVCVQQSRVAQQAAHPLSLEAIEYTYDFLYGKWRLDAPSIPPGRRKEAEAYLARFGISSPQTFDAQYERLYDEALSKGIHTPDAGVPFIPRMSFLYGFPKYIPFRSAVNARTGPAG